MLMGVCVGCGEKNVGGCRKGGMGGGGILVGGNLGGRGGGGVGKLMGWICLLSGAKPLGDENRGLFIFEVFTQQNLLILHTIVK